MRVAKTRIIIVDDHPVVREGFARFIETQEDLAICAVAESCSDALERIKTCQPHLVIVDLSLKDGDGLDLLGDITRHFPEVASLVVSVRDEMLYAVRAMRLGARGYVSKGENREKVLEAIRQVMNGGYYFSPAVQRQLFGLSGATVPKGAREVHDPLKALTDRELQILRFIGMGYSTRRIAECLHLSVKTVDTHRLHIKAKLNTPTMSELVRLAVHWTSREGAVK
ncbi:MAG: response regulator transcription factor [Kiritimatiellae bacterium]|nr:response regulator transcription factor [Kiritimatiellia bacterium]